MIVIQSAKQAKKSARVLEQTMRKRHGHELTHAEALEMVSTLVGFENWNSFSAALGKVPVITELDFKSFSGVRIGEGYFRINAYTYSDELQFALDGTLEKNGFDAGVAVLSLEYTDDDGFECTDQDIYADELLSLRWSVKENVFLSQTGESYRFYRNLPIQAEVAPPDALHGLLQEHRIALTPEYEGGWHAEKYGDSEHPSARAYGKTPLEAVHAVLKISP